MEKAAAIAQLYTPLDESKNEIRLLKFEQPTETSHLLHCVLQVVSLDDFNDGYRSHLAAHGVSGRPRRPNVTSWTKRVKGTEKSPIEPSLDTCRFGWGDYAALSYVWGSEKRKKTNHSEWIAGICNWEPRDCSPSFSSVRNSLGALQVLGGRALHQPS